MKNNKINLEIKFLKHPLVFTFFDWEVDGQLYYLTFKKTNYLKVKDDRIWIESKYTNYECKIVSMLFDINNETFRNYLINKLVRIIKTQHEFIKNIPDINGISGGDYHLRTKHDEQALIINVINHMLYNKNECNILSLVARIVFAINANHLYNNGNKRTSIAALSAILRWFGYYLYFSSDMDKLLDYWEGIICNIANYKNINWLKTDVMTINYIKDIIKDHILIDIRKNI